MNPLSKKFAIPSQYQRDFESKALAWANKFSHFAFLNPSPSQIPYGTFPRLLAVGDSNEIEFHTGVFDKLKQVYDGQNGWFFGHLAYDLKNEVEHLQSENPDHLKNKLASFFRANYLIHFHHNTVLIEGEESDSIFQQIIETKPNKSAQYQLDIKPRTSKDTYLQNVEAIKNHILEGDIYEMNYCMEFYADHAYIDPIGTYLSLNAIAPSPFSVLVKQADEWLICASPERYLKKEGLQLISQPIKGTIKRDRDPLKDQQNKEALLQNEKERAENLMIVDLVRNDLARSAKTGHIKVEELFGIYSYSHVHQMISTVISELDPESHPIDALKMAFPMGSMTGAPKIKTMELIEHYENFRRGLYSGTFGYLDPQGNFDFNVVIRSVLYNSFTQKLSFSVGSAITYDSDAELEYQECLLKSSHIRQILG